LPFGGSSSPDKEGFIEIYHHIAKQWGSSAGERRAIWTTHHSCVSKEQGVNTAVSKLLFDWKTSLKGEARGARKAEKVLFVSY